MKRVDRQDLGLELELLVLAHMLGGQLQLSLGKRVLQQVVPMPLLLLRREDIKLMQKRYVL